MSPGTECHAGIDLDRDAGLADLIEEHGAIVLSGILFEQEQSVIEAGQARGLQFNERRQIGDWVALTMSR